jgi:hypothetical protein
MLGVLEAAQLPRGRFITLSPLARARFEPRGEVVALPGAVPELAPGFLQLARQVRLFVPATSGLEPVSFRLGLEVRDLPLEARDLGQ